MGEVSTIGLDIAKSVFQVHGVDDPAARPPHQQAGHVTAPDQCCIYVRKFLPRRRPHVTQSGRAFKRRRFTCCVCGI